MQLLSISSLISLEQMCPIAKKPFKQLASEHFYRYPQIPYVITIASSLSASFSAFDAAHLQQHFTHHGHHLPKTFEHVSTIHYLFINTLADQFSLFTSCSLQDPICWQYIKACAHEDSDDRFEAQKAVIKWLFAKNRFRECYFWTDVYLKRVPQSLEILKLQVALIFSKTSELSKSSTEKIDLLERVISLDPRADEAYTQLGIIYLHGSREIQPDEKRALYCFEQAVLANSTNQQAACQLTKLKQNSKNQPRPSLLPLPAGIATHKLLTIFQKIPASHVPSLENFADLMRIEANLRLANAQKTLGCLKTILQADEENAYALARIAEIYRKGYPGTIDQDVTQSLSFLEKAFKTGSEDAFINAHLGATYVMLGNIQNALAHLERAKILSPNCIFTLTWLVKLHLRHTKNQVIAKKILEEILDLDANNCFALTELACLLSEGSDEFAQNLKEANVLFERSYKINAKKIKTLIGWAEMLRLYGDGFRKNLQLAKRLFSEALAIDPLNYLANSRTAEILRKSPSGLAAARDLFIETLRLYPSDPFCEARLGAIYLFGGAGVKKAIEIAEKLLRSSIRSRECFALAHFGELQRRLGKDLVQAEHFLLMAYDKNSNDPDTLSFLGLLYRIGGDGVKKERTKATALLEKAFRLAPDDDPIGERIRQPSCISQEVAKTDYSRTKELLECSLKENHENFYTLFALGEFLSQSPESHRNDFLRAEELLCKALQLSPHNVEALKSLAELYRTRKDIFNKSESCLLELFVKANTIEPNDPWTLARLASCYIKQGQFDQAQTQLLLAKKITPKNALVLTCLGELNIAKMLTYAKANKGSAEEVARIKAQLICEAESYFKEAINSDSQYNDAYIGLGYVAIFREEITEAKRCFQLVLSHDPGHPGAIDGLSHCLEQVSLA